VLRYKNKLIPLSTEFLNEQEITDERDECGINECGSCSECEDDKSIIDDDDDDDDDNDDIEEDNTMDDAGDETSSDEVQFLESRQDVISLLQEVGLYDHFKTESGSKYQIESQAQQGCKRVADFLCWAYHDSNKFEFLKKYEALDYFAKILNNDYKQVRRYTNYLAAELLLAPSTVKNYLADIKSAACWRAYDYHSMNDLATINLGGLETISKSILK
jgi:hypothetical protein